MLVIAHGGVSGTERELASLGPAASLGCTASTVLDAVEVAVRSLEDHHELNAGYGATLTAARSIELDAGIMDGATGAAGCVACVAVRHPISLARRVMERTPHVLMFGEGAMALASGMELLEDTTPAQHERWSRAMSEGTADTYGTPEYVDTVGALALDDSGRLAAASSTGGVLGKLPGRVGDAPIVGAGLFASEVGAAVATGVGEVFLRTLACREVVRLIEEGQAPQRACERVVAYLGKIEEVTAAVLALDVNGRVGAAYRGGAWRIESNEGVVRAHRMLDGGSA